MILMYCLIGIKKRRLCLWKKRITWDQFLFMEKKNHLGPIFVYGHGTNNFAEMNALLEGLRLCRDLDLTQVIVESDSTLVVAAIRNKKVDSWNTTYTLRKCIALMGENFQINHVLRQKNFCGGSAHGLRSLT